jgi:TetR/AcrR family transcriptional regulator
MPPRQRTPRPARERILEAALALFARHGLAGTSMDAVARRARVAKGLVFHHFGSKQALYRTAMEATYAALRARQDATDLTGLGPAAGMRRLVTDTFRIFRERPEIVAMMNEENLHRARHIRASKAIPALYNPLLDQIGRLLAQGRDEKLFRADVDPVALYVALSGLGYFYCANRWTLGAAFAGDLFQPTRIAGYEAMIGDMVVAYLTAR